MTPQQHEAAGQIVPQGVRQFLLHSNGSIWTDCQCWLFITFFSAKFKELLLSYFALVQQVEEVFYLLKT